MAIASVPRGNPAASLRRNPAAAWRHLDLVLVGATFALAALGVVMVYSATRSTAAQAGVSSTSFLAKQLSYVILGVVGMTAMVAVDYRRFRELAPAAYIGSLGLLLLVLSPLGTTVNGAQSWFSFGAFQLQPAELAKLAVILGLAAICADARGGLDTGQLVSCLGLFAIPAVLILAQPDLGSTMVFVAILGTMLVVGGASVRQLASLALAGIVAVVLVFQLGVVKDYQRDRILNFADPTTSSGASYNASQARTAIGAGGFAGTGLFNGTQTKNRFVPEQQTDFIFTVVGEELGFVGSATVLVLYAAMAWRIWRAATLARDALGTMLCVGVLAMVIFQVFENMGMTMGIMPITGLPLPFLSYGGSSTLTMFAAVGIVLNVHTRRFS
jgi:rod shape determining protein RodA